jgi:peptidoglycan/LPS O-acetylase OafA/YrhL
MGFLRFLLALAVVLNHTPGAPFLFNGGFAVELFFCISGFYMAMILESKYKGRPSLFYTNRIFRLLPTYALALALGAVLLRLDLSDHIRWAEYQNILQAGQAWPLILTNLTVFGQELASFFVVGQGGEVIYTTVPMEGTPAWKLLVIPQTWSISFELMFYLIAPFLLGSQKNKLLAICLIALASLVLREHVFVQQLGASTWGRRFFPSILFYFLLGSLSYYSSIYLKAKVQPSKVKWPALGLTFLLLLALYKFRYPRPVDYVITYPIIAFAFSAALCLLRAAVKPSSFEKTAGELSYPMYMTHTLFIGLFMNLVHLQGKALALGVSLSTIALSYLIYRYIESPVDAWRQRRVAAAIA